MSVHFQTGFRHLSDLPCIVLRHQNAQAVVSLYGGQVLSYQPTPTTERLWLSPLAQWQNQQAIRGGIPICWPWFGALDSRFSRLINATSNHKAEQHNTAIDQSTPLPNHGLVRTAMWQYQNMETATDDHSSARTTVTLSCTVTPPWQQAPVTLYLEVELSTALSVRLYTHDALPQQAALHSYFSLQHITAGLNLPQIADQAHHQSAPPLEHCMVAPLGGLFIDKTLPVPQRLSTASASHLMSQDASNELHFVGEIDRIYLNTTASLRISSKDTARLDTSAQGTTHIQQYGHDSSVLWNPGMIKAAQLRDVTHAHWQEFVCVETAFLQLTELASADDNLPLAADMKSCRLDLRQVISAD